MKEKLYTIPLNDAINENDECVLCNAQRSLERDAIDFTLGSGASYMESDIREQTDKSGFCRHHFQMMFEYGNSLGNSLILHTHLKRFRGELEKEMKAYKPGKAGGIFSKGEKSSLERFLEDSERKCFVCDYYSQTYKRYIATFFYLYENDSDFACKVKEGKGFCVHHISDLIKGANEYLSKDRAAEFIETLFEVEKKNLARIEEDISWFVDKFDYRNKDADWKNSKDAIPRTIQKLVGGYPADEPYREG